MQKHRVDKPGEEKLGKNKTHVLRSKYQNDARFSQHNFKIVFRQNRFLGETWRLFLLLAYSTLGAVGISVMALRKNLKLKWPIQRSL